MLASASYWLLAAEPRCWRVRVLVEPDNETGRRLYQRAGFRERNTQFWERAVDRTVLDTPPNTGMIEARVKSFTKRVMEE